MLTIGFFFLWPQESFIYFGVIYCLWLLVNQEAALFLYYPGMAAAQISKGESLASPVGVV